VRPIIYVVVDFNSIRQEREFFSGNG